MKYFLLLFFVCSTLHAQNIKILDGDTIHIAKVKYRFHGIDAPEISQICKKNNNNVKCGDAIKAKVN